MPHFRASALRTSVLVLAATAMLVGGCGGVGTGEGTERGGGIIPADALRGAEITVGSKEHTEQLLLGRITIEALEAAGADVTDETGLAGSDAAREALTSGDVDTYWEYTGTGWLLYLEKAQPVADARVQYERVARRDSRENDIVWLEPAPANTTYAFAVRREAMDDLGVERISDFEQLIEERPEEATLCVGREFSRRDDGLAGVEKAYGFEFPDDNVVTVGLGAVYAEVDTGERCNFGEVFTTDGRIEANDLAIIEDDRDVFPKYNPAPNVRREIVERYPRIREVFAPIAEKLDDETLRQLNAQVDVEGIPEDEVATTWLEENGFIG